ncbi:MAG: hypothetical protein ACE37F_09875 [Nannocystaceae bacterium]|nr:hypothetical protein [bacterium]
MQRIFVVLAFMAGCGPSVEDEPPQDEPACDPWAEVCVLNMAPSVGTSVGVDLARAETGDEASYYDTGLACGLSRYLVLGTFESDYELCVLPDPVDDLEDIDVTVCQPCVDNEIGCWTSVAYFGLWGSPPDAFVGRAIVARSGEGDLYRIRVLHDDASVEPASLTIEYEGVM